MRASSVPIWRLKPTMSVNMIAASLRVSAGRMLAWSSDMGQIIGYAACGCQMAGAWPFPCPGEPEGVKRQHAVCELWLCQSRGHEFLREVRDLSHACLSPVWLCQPRRLRF